MILYGPEVWPICMTNCFRWWFFNFRNDSPSAVRQLPSFTSKDEVLLLIMTSMKNDCLLKCQEGRKWILATDIPLVKDTLFIPIVCSKVEGYTNMMIWKKIYFVPEWSLSIYSKMGICPNNIQLLLRAKQQDEMNKKNTLWMRGIMMKQPLMMNYVIGEASRNFIFFRVFSWISKGKAEPTEPNCFV